MIIHRRKQLTSSRLVHGIDSALDLENYNAFQIPENEKQITGVIKDKNNEERITFTNQPNNARNTGRIARQNVITGPIGLKRVANNATTELDHFMLFLTNPMFEQLVNNTNTKIQQFIGRLPDNFNEKFKYPFIKETNHPEMKDFIGLFIYRGLYKLNTMAIKKLFSKKYGPPMFSAVMSRNRFVFILHNFSFDDDTTRNERWKLDRFAVIRVFFESFNDNCMSVLSPGDYLSLDETLYPMRTQIAFKQFNRSKPAKYGLLFKSINAGRFPYTFVSSPYCGKPSEEGGDYYVPGTEAIVNYLVNRLLSKSALAGRNISFDCLYTSIPLSRWLLQKKITCIGTLQLNRKGTPAELKETRDRDLLSTEIYWEDSGLLSLSSYVVTTSKGKKNVMLLATVPQILGTTKDDGKEKLDLFKVYDFTKGGTDIIDQRMSLASSKVERTTTVHQISL